jgi:hypothetical protein
MACVFHEGWVDIPLRRSYGLCIPRRLDRLCPRGSCMAYVYLDGWADYALGVVVWLMYTSKAGQIIPSGMLYGLCIPRLLDRLYPRGSCMAYAHLDGLANYTLGVLVWLMYTSTAGQIIPSGRLYGLRIPRLLDRLYPRR